MARDQANLRGFPGVAWARRGSFSERSRGRRTVLSYRTQTCGGTAPTGRLGEPSLPPPFPEIRLNPVPFGSFFAWQITWFDAAWHNGNSYARGIPDRPGRHPRLRLASRAARSFAPALCGVDRMRGAQTAGGGDHVGERGFHLRPAAGLEAAVGIYPEVFHG